MGVPRRTGEKIRPPLPIMSIRRRPSVVQMNTPQRRGTKGSAVKYLLLIYTSEADDMKRFSSPADGEAVMAEYFAYMEAIQKSGKFAGGEALQSVTTATTVRVRDGKTQATDGPFAETKEQLGGYYMVDARDLDEAISWAARIPGAKWGSVEVRPIMEMTMPGQ